MRELFYLMKVFFVLFVCFVVASPSFRSFLLSEFEDVTSGPRIQNVAGLEPAFARHRNADLHVVEVTFGMRIGIFFLQSLENFQCVSCFT